MAAGRQAYVVCPLVGESEKLEVASAEQTLEELANDQLDGLRLGLLHGRIPADEGDVTMAAFRAGELDVLVATTVIEVGVDVPNATDVYKRQAWEGDDVNAAVPAGSRRPRRRQAARRGWQKA